MILNNIDNLIEERTNTQFQAIQRASTLGHKAVKKYGSQPQKLLSRQKRIEQAKKSVIEKLSPFTHHERPTETPSKHPYRLTNPAWAKNE